MGDEVRNKCEWGYSGGVVLFLSLVNCPSEIIVNPLPLPTIVYLVRKLCCLAARFYFISVSFDHLLHLSLRAKGLSREPMKWTAAVQWCFLGSWWGCLIYSDQRASRNIYNKFNFSILYSLVVRNIWNVRVFRVKRTHSVPDSVINRNIIRIHS